MSSLLVGFSVFAAFLAVITNMRDVIKVLGLFANELRPYDNIITLLFFSMVILVVYYAYKSNILDKIRPRIYNPQLKSAEDFEKDKKTSTKEALQKLMNSPEYRLH